MWAGAGSQCQLFPFETASRIANKFTSLGIAVRETVGSIW